ncbi:MAG: VWA domain-containing protein [Verrucomicrobia bacterium]|jgi:hypothetical protein|nr:VWA domain-containing protein [Verrucomicrobiota bacterium]MBT7065253.1 VWA domain-containing protein [Verrucomicrobiota bacterium]MBT7701711.1 VWA domain-containing protein [Verrucomicrobiota bacterium]
MSFLNSLPLWGSLAALGVALPILIHVWSRRQRIEIHWAAMELLKKAMVKRSQQIRMEDRLLLLLRCLTLLLIAVALLRPLFSAGDAGESSDVGVVIGIDASYSMGHGQPARFEQAVARARDVLSTMSEGDPVSIVFMSSHPQILFRGVGYDPGTCNKALDEAAEVSAYPLNLERNLEQLQELVRELKTAVRECHIITDAQESDWQALSDQARNTLQELGEEAHVFLAPVSSVGAENLSLTDLSYAAGALQRDGFARFSAAVHNTGIESVEGAMVEFLTDGKLKARQEVGRLEAGDSVLVSFFTSFDAAGDIALTARLSSDALAADNERHAVVAIRSSVRVLCVDGDAGDGSGDTARGAFFAVRALRLKHADATAPIRVTHVDAAGLYGEKLSGYDVVMMINVADVNPDLGKRLGQFVDSGGGLMVFLGDKVDPEQYNESFTSDDKPLLPVRLIETLQHDDATRGWQIAAPESDHAVAQLVGRLPRDLIAEARFHTIVRAVPRENGESILELDGGSPLLLGSRDGGILVFTSSADRSWNNLPVHPLFTILLQQSTTMLSSPEKMSRGIVGEPATMPLPGRMMGDEVMVSQPSGEAEPAQVTVVDGASVVVITPDAPGVYRIEAEAGLAPVSVAANVDAAESQIRAPDARTLRRWLDGVPVEIVAGGVAAAAVNSRTGRDLGLTLLVLGAICFFVQGLWANHKSRRKYATDTSVAESLQDRQVAAARRG